MTGIWRAWLKLWCLASGLFGLVLVLAGVPGNEPLANRLFAAFGQAPSGIEPALRFATALMGAVTLGWAASLYVAFMAADQLPPDVSPRFWRNILLAVLVWYVVDSCLSVATGFPLNALSNTVLIVGLLIPIWASGRLSTAS